MEVSDATERLVRLVRLVKITNNALVQDPIPKGLPKHGHSLENSMPCLLADHIQVKLRSVGRILVPKGEGSEAPLSDHEIELLAEMEHRRWWAERSLDGWKFAKNRNDSLKEHPNMVPYDQLDSASKDNDRNNVRKMLKIQKGEDQIIVMGNVALNKA
jgi:hypothetical protein